MAKVPYSPVPSVGAQSISTPKFSPEVPAGAFGGNVAAAVSTLGQTVSGIGDELAKRAIAMQELANQTEAKEAESRYIIKAGELRAGYSALQGKDAVDGYKPYMENLKKAREEVRDSLSNHASQRLYDGPSLNTMSYTIYNGASHAATQQKTWVMGASEGRVATYQTRALNEPKDDLAFQRSLVGTVEEVSTQRDIKGWSPEVAEAVATQKTSALWSARVQGLARTEPFTAQQMLNEAIKRKDIQGEDIEKSAKVVETYRNSTGSRMIASEISKGMPDASLEERVAAAEAKADTIAPGDVNFRRGVRNEIDVEWNREKKIENDNKFNAYQTVAGAITAPKSGQIPTSEGQLLADPAIAEAWIALPERQKQEMRKALVNNAKGDVTWTPERHMRYNGLKGMAALNPIEFLEQNIAAVDIPWVKRDELINIQNKIKAAPGTDPRVTKALQVLRPDLSAAGVLQNKEDYAVFAGALWDQLNDFQAINNKPPKGDEVLEMGRKLLQEKAVGGWSRKLDPEGWGKERIFRLQVPENDREEIKQHLLERNQREPSDYEIRRRYVREQYHKLYGKSPSTSESK